MKLSLQQITLFILFSHASFATIENIQFDDSFSKPCKCEHLYGEALFTCMKRLNDKEYKTNLINLNHDQYQRLDYFTVLLKTPEAYEEFFSKFGSEEWERFWQTQLTEEEHKYFPKNKKDCLEFVNTLKNDRWWYNFKWCAGIGVIVVITSGTGYYLFGPLSGGTVAQGVFAGGVGGLAVGVAGLYAYQYYEQKKKDNSKLKEVN